MALQATALQITEVQITTLQITEVQITTLQITEVQDLQYIGKIDTNTISSFAYLSRCQFIK